MLVATSDAVVGDSTLALAALTGLLAIATFLMVWQARKEAKAVTQQVTLEREQMDAATRPLVYPMMTHEFAWGTAGSRYDLNRGHLLPLKNGGPGIALNVIGACYLRNLSGGPRRSVEIHSTTLAPGEMVDARMGEVLQDGFAGVEGFVEYEDLAGDKWTTHFRFGRGTTNELACSHERPGKVADLGDPRQRYRDDLGLEPVDGSSDQAS